MVNLQQSFLTRILGALFRNPLIKNLPARKRVPEMAGKDCPLVWIDCEMTGLNPDSEEIIEIFCLVTDGDLNLKDEEGWGTVVHQTQERMDKMDEWCTKQHGGSGLTARVVGSTTTPEEAADGLLAYIKKHVPNAGVALLAGSSVHHDRAFLRRAPYNRVTDHLHYRILDVSSIKEAAKRWAPKVAKKVPNKKGTHLARDDILESIEEARYYREGLFAKALQVDELEKKIAEYEKRLAKESKKNAKKAAAAAEKE